MNELIALSPELLADRPEFKRQSVEDAAREFETMLISQWLKSAREASQVLAEGNDMAGSDSYLEMAEKSLAKTMASRDTFGLAQMMMNQLQPLDSK
jgi:Rod binding domain-containing protein